MFFSKAPPHGVVGDGGDDTDYTNETKPSVACGLMLDTDSTVLLTHKSRKKTMPVKGH